MKNMILMGIMIAAMSGTGFADEAVEWTGGIARITELNLENAEGTIEDFCAGKMGDVAFEFPEGAKLPFRIQFSGELMALESEAPPMQLKILKTCYVRCQSPEQFEFSSDLKNWRELSTFFTGNVNASVGADEQGTTAGMSIELNERK